MRTTYLHSNRRLVPMIRAAFSTHGQTSSLQKRLLIRAFGLMVCIGGVLGAPQKAHAQNPQQPGWELNLEAKSVTPTSQFNGSARFFAPGRHRFHHRRLHYTEYAPSPDGYVLRETAHRPLVWSGALLLGIPYAAGLTYAVLADFPGHSSYLAIPIVGPWLARGEESERATRVVLGLDGLVQASGAVLLTLGLTLTRKEWVPYQQANVWVMPAATARGNLGLVAGGTF
jgi:hypothetical protein